MTSRQRVIASINHIQPDKVPLDIGSSSVTGIHAIALSRLKAKLGLAGPVTVSSPTFMLGAVEEDVQKSLQVDVLPLSGPVNNMGVPQTDFKPWKFFDGTETLIAGGLYFSRDKDGNLYNHPCGDPNTPPSAKMPKDGFYFDAVDRQGEIDEGDLDARRDYGAEYTLMGDAELEFLRKKAEFIANNTPCAGMGNFGRGSLGDFGALPGFAMKQVRGIRRPEDWLVAHLTHPNYVKDRYELQTEMALQNLKLYKQADGDAIQVIIISATDFGTQRCEIMSRDMYREFYFPYHKRINSWVHENTHWKVFFHTCGAVSNLLDDFIDAGVDILNPVQCSAEGMDAQMLKGAYGSRLVFWGGGIDTQRTLQFGTAEQVYQEAGERLRVFAPGGGFVMNAVHNIQPGTPPENILAFVQALRDFNDKN